MAELMPCPCGMVPTRLVVDGDGERPKWAMVTGICCTEWHLHFRNSYHPIDSEESNRLAREAWNAAPRAKQEAGG